MKNIHLFILLLLAVIVPSQANFSGVFAIAGRWLMSRMFPSQQPQVNVQNANPPANSDPSKPISFEEISNLIVNRFGELAPSNSTTESSNATEITTDSEVSTTDLDVSASQNVSSLPANETQQETKSFGNIFALYQNRFIPEQSSSTVSPSSSSNDTLSIGSLASILANETAKLFSPVENDLGETPQSIENVTDIANLTDTLNDTVPHKVSLGELLSGQYTTLPPQIEVEQDGEVYQVNYN